MGFFKAIANLNRGPRVTRKPLPPAPERGILRKPAAQSHSVQYGNTGEVIADERREHLFTDSLPSTNSGPYPPRAIRAPLPPVTINHAPQYTGERRGLSDRNRSEIPSYHSRRSVTHGDERKASASSSDPYPSSRSRRAPDASFPSSQRATVPTISPRLCNRGTPLCVPQPTPTTAELTNPWDAEDTPVIPPFKAEEVDYEGEDEGYVTSDNEDDSWDPSQRDTFEAIQSMLRHKSRSGGKGLARSVRTESEASSAYTQDDHDDDDDILNEIIDTYSDESLSDVPQARSQSMTAEDECLIPPPTEGTRHLAAAPQSVRRRFEEARHEREPAQLRLEMLFKKVQTPIRQ